MQTRGSFFPFAAENGLDFIAASQTVTYRRKDDTLCASFRTLSDSLALEESEEFEVSFTLDGPKDAEGRLLINEGRDRAIAENATALVRIMDQNGMMHRQSQN